MEGTMSFSREDISRAIAGFGDAPELERAKAIRSKAEALDVLSFAGRVARREGMSGYTESPLILKCLSLVGSGWYGGMFFLREAHSTAVRLCSPANAPAEAFSGRYAPHAPKGAQHGS